MVSSLVAFIKSAFSLLGMTWLGVAGLIDGVNVEPTGLAVESYQVPEFAIGDIAYYGQSGDPNGRDHELGHLQHEDELGMLYLPIAGLTSLVGRIGGAMGWIDSKDYYNLWTERTADEYGGIDN